MQERGEALIRSQIRVLVHQLQADELAAGVAFFDQQIGIGGVQNQIVRVLDEGGFQGFARVSHSRQNSTSAAFPVH